MAPVLEKEADRRQKPALRGPHFLGTRDMGRLKLSRNPLVCEKQTSGSCSGTGNLWHGQPVHSKVPLTWLITATQSLVFTALESR